MFKIKRKIISKIPKNKQKYSLYKNMHMNTKIFQNAKYF